MNAPNREKTDMTREFPRDRKSLSRAGKFRLRPYRYRRLTWRIAARLIDFCGEFVRMILAAAAVVLRFAASLFRSGDHNKQRRSSPELISLGPLPFPKRILLMQTDHLGDAVLSTGLLLALKHRFPQTQIDVLSGRWNRSLFAMCPEVSRVFIPRVNRFDRLAPSGKRIGPIMALLGAIACGLRLRKRDYDLAIDPRGEIFSIVTAFAARIRVRVGWDNAGGGFLLTHTPEWIPSRHEVSSRAALLREIGALWGSDHCESNAQEVAPRLVPRPADIEMIVRRLVLSAEKPCQEYLPHFCDRAPSSLSMDELGRKRSSLFQMDLHKPLVESLEFRPPADDVSTPEESDGQAADFMKGGRRFQFSSDSWDDSSSTDKHPSCSESSRRFPEHLIVLHVGAGTSAKRWPMHHWRELLGRILLELDVKVILVGSESDRVTARGILDGEEWPGIFDWTGELTLGRLAALISIADLFVGADSGPAHMAAAVGTPTIVLFSGTNDPEQWRPWENTGNSVRLVRADVPCSPCGKESCPIFSHLCMEWISPRKVVAEIVELAESWTTHGNASESY